MELRARATAEQFSTLLKFMESNGDLARPQVGVQGRLRSEQLWQKLTNMLNSVGGGVRKTPDKWKKVWADWKSKTKKKALILRHKARRTGGGPSSRLNLSMFEERVLNLIGLVAVEGQPLIEELGISRPSQSDAPALPSPPPPNLSIKVEISEINALSQSPVPDSLSPQPSSSHQLTTTCPQIPILPKSNTPTPSNIQRTPGTSESAATITSPRRRHSRIRRRRAFTPFDRGQSEFAAIELRRLELEEVRSRQQHERELLAIEAQREHTQVLRSLVDVAQAWLNYYQSRDSTDSLNND